MRLDEQIYNIFNDDGRLIQLEYGLEALQSGYQIVSVLSDTEIVFVSKKTPQLPLQAESHNSIFQIAKGLYVNITGVPVDIDYVLDRAKTLAASTNYELGCTVGPDIFTTTLAEKFQKFIQRTAKRIPAFALTVGGFENGVPKMYYTDMSAVHFPCFAAAAGEDCSKMTKHLEKNYKREDRGSAVELAISALLQSIGRDAEATEIQVGVLTNDGIVYLSDQKINEIIQRITEVN